MEDFYKRQESLILRATEEFAKVHNVHYSTMTKSMVKNAMREMRRVVLDEVTNTKTGTDNAVLPDVSKRSELLRFQKFYNKLNRDGALISEHEIDMFLAQ